jgi:predicted sulfurtransferase
MGSGDKTKKGSLGSWFPKASVVKNAEYGARLNLGGRLRVSREGINATITGAELDCRTFAKELGEFDANVLKTDFKLLIILFKNQYYIKNQTRY